MTGRYRYSAGSAILNDAIAPDELLNALGDSLFGPGTEEALRNALHQGVSTEDGAHLSGLDDLRSAISDELNKRYENLSPDDLAQMLEALQSQGGGLESSDDFGDSADFLRALTSGLDAARLSARQFDDADSGKLAELIEQLGSEMTGGASPQSFANEMQEVADLLELETSLARVANPSDVLDIDLEQIKHLLDDDRATSVGALAAGLVRLRSEGFITGAGRETTLSPKALRQIGRQLLVEAFEFVDSRSAGAHQARDSTTPGVNRGEVTREYRFGDRFDPDLSSSILRAARRSPGVPVQIHPNDFQIFDQDRSGRAALTICLDVSRSMEERGYLAATRRAALAIGVLIEERFPRDEMHLIAFSDEARSISHVELSNLTWNRHEMGTNVQDALRLARETLNRASDAHRTILLITDGEPTAHRDREGNVIFAEPATEESLAATYAEGMRLRRSGIDLHVLLMNRDQHVARFANELSKNAGGNVWLTDPDSLTPLLAQRYRRTS